MLRKAMIVDIHPDDAYYKSREETIGKIGSFSEESKGRTPSGMGIPDAMKEIV